VSQSVPWQQQFLGKNLQSSSLTGFISRYSLSSFTVALAFVLAVATSGRKAYYAACCFADTVAGMQYAGSQNKRVIGSWE